MNYYKKLFSGSFNTFLFFFLISGILSVCIGQDANWDLLNYHLYNPYALLTGRIGIDIAPAGLHTFFNPLLDIPFYLLTKVLFNFPKTIAFIMALPYALCLFITFKIIKLFFTKEEDDIYVWIALILGAFGVMAFSLLGTTMGDVQSAVFILLALYLLFRFFIGEKNKWFFIIAFLSIGFATGAKQTCAIFCLPFGLFLFFASKNLKEFLLLGLSATGLFTIGFFAANGYWMYILYKQTQNPFFPFLNAIFKSPLYADLNFRDIGFLPRNIIDGLIMPFKWGRINNTSISEFFADYKLLFAYFASFSGILLLFKKRKEASFEPMFLLSVFWFSSFIIWVFLFNIIRYLTVLDFLNGLMFVVVFLYAIKGKYAKFALFFIIGFGLGQTVYPKWLKVMPYAPTYFKMKVPVDVEDNSLVLIQGEPLTFLIPYLNPKAVYMGGITYEKLFLYNNDDEPEFEIPMDRSLVENFFKHNFKRAIQRKINGHDGKIYLLSYKRADMFKEWQIGQFGLASLKEQCEMVRTNLNILGVTPLLCLVEKVRYVPEDAHPLN